MAPPGAFKKELMQAKRRESEMAARLSALEGEVQLARNASQTQQAQTDDLTGRLTACTRTCSLPVIEPAKAVPCQQLNSLLPSVSPAA